MSVSATMYSFQAAMKAKMTAVTIPGSDSGSDDPDERAELTASVHGGRLLDLPREGGEGRAQDPDRKGQVEGRLVRMSAA